MFVLLMRQGQDPLPRWVALPMGGPPTAVGGPALGAFHVMAVLGVGCPPGNDLGLGSGSC